MTAGGVAKSGFAGYHLDFRKGCGYGQQKKRNLGSGAYVGP
jgi:hypothetical protein